MVISLTWAFLWTLAIKHVQISPKVAKQRSDQIVYPAQIDQLDAVVLLTNAGYPGGCILYRFDLKQINLFDTSSRTSIFFALSFHMMKNDAYKAQWSSTYIKQTVNKTALGIPS